MSELDGYKPFAIIRNSIDKLESQGLLKLIGEKEGGKVNFIYRIEFDANQGLLTLDLQSDPESNRIDRKYLI